jgi:hypothetical protein
MRFSLALLNTGINSRFRNGYKLSRVSFVTSSEKLIHTMNEQRLETINSIGFDYQSNHQPNTNKTPHLIL